MNRETMAFLGVALPMVALLAGLFWAMWKGWV